MKNSLEFKLNRLILKKIIPLAVFAIVIIPNPLLAQTATSAPAICDITFEGYIYSTQDKTCVISKTTSCQNPFEYTSKDACEKNNALNSKLNEAPDRSGTILDRAKADRQSFVKSRLYDTDTSNKNIPSVDVLSGQILQANREVLLLEVNQSITKTHTEIVYLENIIIRLKQKLNEIEDGTVTTDINNFLKEAQLKIDNASSTLSQTKASSTAILTADPLGSVLSYLKIDILNTVKELRESQNLIRQAIIEVKKII